jgi:transcriptional regulator with XRE-family HTH domain
MLPAEINARSLPKLATAVRALRLHRGLTQAQLARAAGVSRQWVVNVEAGRTRGIEVGRLMALLDVLHASLMIRDDSETEE